MSRIDFVEGRCSCGYDRVGPVRTAAHDVGKGSSSDAGAQRNNSLSTPTAYPSSGWLGRQPRGIAPQKARREVSPS
jgi:hypothetical protein